MFPLQNNRIINIYQGGFRNEKQSFQKKTVSLVLALILFASSSLGAFAAILKTDSNSGNEIKNLFEHAEGDLTYLSRSDVKNTYPAPPSDYKAPDAVKNSDKRPDPVTEGEAPKTGVKHKDGVIKLSDVAKDETLWEAFLDQLTVDEMITLITDCGYETAAIDRLGIPGTSDNDGPSCIKGEGGLLYSESGLAFPVATALACTWNDELAEEFGRIIGEEGNQLGTPKTRLFPAECLPR